MWRSEEQITKYTTSRNIRILSVVFSVTISRTMGEGRTVPHLRFVSLIEAKNIYNYQIILFILN